MMLINTSGEKSKLAVCDRAPIGDHKAEIGGVELHRTLDVAHKYAAVAETNVHGRPGSVELDAGCADEFVPARKLPIHEGLLLGCGDIHGHATYPLNSRDVLGRAHQRADRLA